MKTFLPHERREQLRHRLNRIIAKLLRKEIFWDYDLNDDGYLGEQYPTLDAARAGAEEFFGDWCIDNGQRYTAYAMCNYIEYFFDRNGEQCVMRELFEEVGYTYERSDREEHFAQRDYI